MEEEKPKISPTHSINILDFEEVLDNAEKCLQKSDDLTVANSSVNSKKLSKQKKNCEKDKKLVKKEKKTRQGKKSDDQENKNEKKDLKSTDKRRRSDRLKSKPEYNDKYEDQLLTSLENNKEKLTVNHNSRPENSDEISQTLNSDNTVKINENFIRTSDDVSDMPPFRHIVENEYLTERSFSKDAERMICDCVLTKEEIFRGERGCGEDCLNRLLLIECCSRCTLGDRCTNKRFQKREYAKCEAYKTKKKGFGLRVLENIPSGTFIMEYVGEVVNSDEFEERAMKYARGKIPHFYFMSLKSDCIIDATVKGNFSRFINHSCEPNAETQKWTVQGELRIGFFSKRSISAGEEITFDYQLQRYGKQAQRCYCETPSCTGWIGEDPDKQVDDDKRKERKKKKRDEYLDWETALDEICQIGLINRHQTLSLNRLMVHAKELPVRMQILQLIEEGHPSCRRLFVDYHGLPIIWSWMVDCTSDQEELKIQLLKTLMALPITNKTILVDSKVFSLVEQWAFVVDQKLRSEALSAQSVLESVEDIVSADETPVSELAQKLLHAWSSLREAYKIPKKERIQQMKEHEREADQNIVKPRPRRLPLYAEKIRDRYHRNRYNRDKDFEKIYYDRMRDYDKADKHKRKRESPDKNRSFDNRDHHRKSEYRESANKMSRMEHRYMFEMKIAREKEERRREEVEFLKRKWEGEEQNFWIQQNQNLYYGAQQHQLVSGQFIPSVPPPSYTSDVSMMSTGMLQNIQPLTTSRTHSHNYYTPQSSYISPNIVLTHLPPPSTSLSHTQQSTPSMLLSSQVNASPQTYYQNSVPLSSYANNASTVPVSYTHHTLTELTTSNTIQRTEVEFENTSYSVDYQALQNHLQQDTPVEEIPIPNEEQGSLYSDIQSYEYTENNSTSNTFEQFPTNYSSSSKEYNAAIANAAAAAAIDITKLKLPPKWKAARDSEGRVYYYHTKTRLSQWYPPVWEEPQPNEDTEHTDLDDSTEEDSSIEDDDDIDIKKRRKYENAETLNKRNYHREKFEKETCDQNSYDMDAEIKENLAAMSSEFQDTDNEDYSPVLKDIEEQKCNFTENEPMNEFIPPSTIPLITEHIISPREPIDEKERIRNKRRIRNLKEKLRKQKRQKNKLNSINENSGSCNNNGVYLNNSITSSSGSSNKLISVPADTSSITDRKRKDAFRSSMANYVVHCLNPYFRSSCTIGRIENPNDFKHLARKLTHFVMLKELKHCRSATDLSCNSSVKHKAREYIRKYMSKFGEVYERPPDDTNY